MVSNFLIVTSVILICYIIFKYMTYRPKNFPAGPPRIPIFGTYLLLLLMDYNHLQKAVLTLCRIYKSKVIGFYLGSTPTIFASDYESVRELFFRPEFDGKTDTFIARLRDPKRKLRGVFFTEGEIWKEQRRFMLRYLRDWGFGCRSQHLELELKEEITLLIDLLNNGPMYPHEQKYFKGDSVLCPDIFYACLLNCSFEVLCGERLPRLEQECLFGAGANAMKFIKSNDNYGRLISIIPWIRYFFPEMSGYKFICDGNEGIYNYIKKVVDKCSKSYERGNERHVIDLYLTEIQKAQEEGTETSFLYDNLLMNCTDFLFPPVTAVTQTITFLFQRLILYPEVLKKIQNEIDDVVGQGRLPTLDDRATMPYTEATLREILRHETLVPSGLPHKALVDTEYLGYTVPKDTIMVTGLYAMHYNIEMWGDPHNFRPERFLDENGRLCLKKDKTFPFGAGKRVCAGETFARNIMFLLGSAIIQHFNVRMPNGVPIPDLTKNKTGQTKFTPDNFYLRFEPRLTT